MRNDNRDRKALGHHNSWEEQLSEHHANNVSEPDELDKKFEKSQKAVNAEHDKLFRKLEPTEPEPGDIFGEDKQRFSMKQSTDDNENKTKQRRANNNIQ